VSDAKTGWDAKYWCGVHDTSHTARDLINEHLAAANPPVADPGRELREAAKDVVIQEGRYYERDGSGESKFLAVVPKAALSRLSAALRGGSGGSETGR
jgi:hypothetical protein